MIIVFAHGMYDAFIVLPDLMAYSMVGMIIYILLAYQFFRELRPLRIRSQDPVSLTAVFLACVSLLVSATIVYLAARFGLAHAVRSMTQETLSMALMVYMFLREMPNSLVRG